MTWADFKTLVLGYSDVDATRRGITAFRDSFTRAAVVDLKHFVDLFKDDVDGAEYEDTDSTPFFPFEEKASEAVAMYFKSKTARTVDKDLAMSESYWKDFTRVRRELMRESSDVALEQQDDATLAACILHQLVHCILPANLN
jgi:hypothetical protein